MVTRRIPSALVIGMLALPAAATPLADLTDLSLEDLLDVQVVSASRHVQKASEAPSSVTVLHGEDFRTWGWRTLAEALNSVRGFLTTNGREYTYVAARGFSTPGDYNSRLLVMIDGIRTNGNVFDQAYVGHEFPLDLDLVDHIEIVRGPGSMVYGGNAFFAVINVVTKSGAQVGGAELAVGGGSFAGRNLRMTYGRRLENGADVLISASGFDHAGQALYFPELGQASRGTDDEHAQRLFARYRSGDLQFTALWGSREHGRPSGAYGSVFNDPRNRDRDQTLLLDARMERALGADGRLTGRLFYGQWEFRGGFVNDNAGPPYDLDRERAFGRWVGVDGQYQYDGMTGHRLLFGVDFQNNLRQDQYAADEPPSLRCVATGSATSPCVDLRRRSQRLGFYAQDDVVLTDNLSLNIGLRHDRSTTADGRWSPRAGMIWRPTASDVVKLLYGTAFRAPNVYEREYAYPGPGAQAANRDLRTETVRTYEAVWEKFLGPDLRISSAAYFYQVDGWMVQVADATGALQFRNQPRIDGRGLEFEMERRFGGGMRLRGSYTGQFVPERPHGILNSPSRHLVKINLAIPLPGGAWRLGIEGQFASGQATTTGRTAAYGIANAHLRWSPAGSPATELSFGIFNLFDRKYRHSYADDSLWSGIRRESIAQDGRTWRAKLVHRF